MQMYPTDEANPDAFVVCERVKCFSIFAVNAKMAGNHASARITLLKQNESADFLVVYTWGQKDVLVWQERATREVNITNQHRIRVI